MEFKLSGVGHFLRRPLDEPLPPEEVPEEEEEEKEEDIVSDKLEMYTFTLLISP
jgi:hypothetical protein